MDPISTIVAALVAGAAEAARPTAVQLVKDSYAGLKAVIQRRFAKASTPIQAVEEKPGSDVRQQALKEELVEAKADRDADVQLALQALLEALRAHAPQSVLSIDAKVSGGQSIQGGTFQGPVTLQGGAPHIQSGGGTVILGTISTGGAPFVSRDHVINNISLHGMGQIQDLTSVLQASLGRLVARPEPEALDLVGAVLDEISKLYQLIDTETTHFLSLTLEDVSRDRAVLLSLDGGMVMSRASEARGHCSKISRIYEDKLHSWFRTRLGDGDLNRVERSFSLLGHSDVDMANAIREVADWLSEKASLCLNRLDLGDADGARKIVKEARIAAHPMRQALARTISTMRDIQSDLLSASETRG